MRAVIVTNRVKRYVNGYKVMIEPLMEKGYEVIWAADFKDFKENLEDIPCKIHQTDFRSNPLDVSNVKAYFQLSELLNQKPVEVIHCNTPIGGLIGRLCAKRAKVKKIIYTAHGFHFYRGAPFINKTLFKWGEEYLAQMTDILITINKEDYEAAQQFRLKRNGRKYLVHGVGIDTGYQSNRDSIEIRESLGVPNSSIMIFSAGELNKNKNNETIIRAIAKTKRSDIYYVLCGEGNLKLKLEKLAHDLGVGNRVKLLGFRTDVLEILAAADIFAMPSYREGLPRSLMEAMDAGKSCVVSNIRGNSDLVKEGEGGYLRSPSDVKGFAEAIEKLSSDQKIRKMFGERNKKVVKEFDFKNVKKELEQIYQEISD